MSELVSSLADHVRTACKAAGIDPATGGKLAAAIVKALRRTHGGERHYIPTVPDDRREEALRLLQTGYSVAEVARAVGVAPSTVYRWWNRRQRRLLSERSQGLGRDGWGL